MNEKAKCKNCTDEMIEEMKQILVDYALKYDLCFSFEVMRKHAEVLIKAGYRNCKDKVVLSKEEYSDYLTLKNNYAHAKAQAERLQADNERLYKNLGKFKESVRKETAKEIYLEMIGEFEPYIATEIAKEIAKKYGVEVEE